MLEAIMVWTGAVLGFVLLLMMALGPLIVELDSWWYEHKHNRRVRKATKAAAAQTAQRRELASV